MTDPESGARDGFRPKTAGTTLPAAGAVEVLDDLDRAQALGSTLFYPQRMTALTRPRDFAMSVRAARIGPVLIGELSCGTDIRIDCGDLLTSYHVNLPLQGRLVSSHRGAEVVATAQRAALYGPVGTTVLSRWEAGCHQLCVKIDRVAFETAVSGFLGREITGILPFGSVLDISTGPGRSWAELAVLLNDLLHRPDSIVGEPLVARSLYASLLTGLIVASGIEHRVTGPRRPEPTGRPRTIDRAVAYLQEHAGEPIGVADVAAHCFVSVRTLQQGFERHLGQSPMQCLRAIRLRRAHEDLLAADPHENTVAAIAHRWGFTHLGRFAAAHEATFGEPPSRTLHRPG